MRILFSNPSRSPARPDVLSAGLWRRSSGAVTISISVDYFKASLSRFDAGEHGMLTLFGNDWQAHAGRRRYRLVLTRTSPQAWLKAV